MRFVSRRWEILFSFVFLDFTSTCREQPVRACSHDPGTAHLPRGNSLTPGSTFASVHGLTSVTVHMNFSWPWGNFERRVTRCTAGFAKVTILHVNRTQKLSPGKSSLTHAHYQCLE